MVLRTLLVVLSLMMSVTFTGAQQTKMMETNDNQKFRVVVRAQGI